MAIDAERRSQICRILAPASSLKNWEQGVVPSHGPSGPLFSKAVSVRGYHPLQLFALPRLACTASPLRDIMPHSLQAKHQADTSPEAKGKSFESYLLLY